MSEAASPDGGIREMSVQDVRDARERGDAMRLIDVREPWEIQTASIEGAEAATEDLMNELIEKGDREARYVFVCHHGIRSMDAAAFFAQQGFKNVASMAGGIESWAVEIDQSVARY